MSLLAASPTGFEVQLADEHSQFPTSNASAAAGSVSWSSGVIRSTDPHYQLPSAGVPAFKTDTTYKWRVRLFDGASPSAWSGASFFDTAPDDTEWASAQWIGGGSEE